MNLFFKKIPINNAQEVIELQSWTITWNIQGDMYKTKKVQHKAFIKKEDALEYIKQLKSSADFLGTWVETDIKEN